MDHLGSHASPLLYALLPLYALAPGVPTLFALQAAALALVLPGAWALGRARLGAWAALVLALALALHPAIRTTTWDVHAEAFAPAWLVGALALRLAGRRLLALGLLLVAMSAKENVGLVAVAWGALCLLTPGRRLEGLGVAALGLAWIAWASWVIIPGFGGDMACRSLLRYEHLGAGFGQILLAPLVRPAAFWGTLLSPTSAVYLLGLLAPLAFLPLLSWRGMLLASPILLMNLLSRFGPTTAIEQHYDMLALPGLVWGTIEGLGRLAAWSGVPPTRPGRLVPAALVLLAALPVTSAGVGRDAWDTVATPQAPEDRALVEGLPAGENAALPDTLVARACDRPLPRALSGPRDIDRTHLFRMRWALVPRDWLRDPRVADTLRAEGFTPAGEGPTLTRWRR